MLRNIYILCFFVFISCKLFAQKDLPNPPPDFQSIPAGSFVIAMDTSYQKIVPVGQAPFNLKAYGLINKLLQNGFPVKWAIRAGKTLNGIDFTAQAERIFPSTTAPAMMNFRGGPFIVSDTSICGLTTQNIIQSFGNNVCVYQLKNTEVIDIRYSINNRPKVAIFTNGGNQLIHAKILDAAGISNYDFLDAANISSLNNCYTLVSEPHWDFISANPVVVNGVKNFVINGGNFFAQCQALETYENYGFFGTTTGISLVNKVVTNTYHNTDLPILQINGTVMENQNGSVRNYAPRAGSTWKNTTYKVISFNGGDTIVALGMHLAPATTMGGNAYFLGSHDYYALNDLRRLNALRMYLNAVFIPSVNNNVWASAGSDQSMSCVGGISLGCSPTGPPGANYVWTPSSGLSCTTCPNPVAIPLSSTNYVVTVTNSSGCTSSDNVMITTNLVYPLANFSAAAVCENSSTAFINQSTNSPVQWNWNFGDGNTSTAQNPVHTYSSPGTYDVTLTAINNIGCTDTIHKNVIVNPKAVASFSSTASCFTQPTCFTNASTISSGSITNWSWNFGDPGSGSSNTSIQQNPCHTYTTQGINATLTLTTNAGCQSSISLPVTFSPDPVSSFSATVSCTGGTTCFTDLSSVSSGSIVGWSWNFLDAGSGANNTSSAQNPCHLYSTSNNRSAQLTVTSNQGCQNTYILPVSFYPLPVTAFNATTSCLGNATCFSDLSSVSTGTIASRQWSFGEAGSGGGNISSSQNPCHTYSTAGSFNVTLTNISNQGCQSSVASAVAVSPLPVIDFTPSWACLGAQTCFINISTIASGSFTGFYWNFSEPVSGSLDTSSLQNPCYVFSSLNPVDITVVLTSDKGCKDTLQRSMVVSNVPTANFNSTVVCPGITTCFSDLSTITTGSIVDWQWDFSDAASGPADSSSLQNPCHVFLNTSPNVTLTVTSNIGCQNTITIPVSFNPEPASDFSATNSCFGNQTCFTNLTSISSGNIVSHQWDFGEPSSGTANLSVSQNPCHTYSAANSFDVSLTTISDNGCQNNITHAVSVSPLPVADFSTSKTCLGNQTCFTDLSGISSGSIISYNWNFNDAGSGGLNSSSQANPCHLFSSLSPYNVTLILTSDKGCNDTVTSSVIVSPVPVANFSSTIECPGNATCFSDFSSIASGNITNWEWNFSDSSSGSSDSSNSQNPCHTFMNRSSPNVSLIVTSDSGCNNTVVLPMTFNPVPVVDFNATTACFGNQTCFTNLSSLSSGTISTIQWDFGDSITVGLNYSSLQSPCHSFSSANAFTVSLDIMSDMGCQSNVIKPVSVSPLPVANFSASKTCLGNQTCFTDLSGIPSGSISSYNWNFNDAGSGGLNSSSQANPCHLFSSLSPYNVTLILTSDKGCNDTVTSSVIVSPVPVTNFSSTIECPGNATCFSDFSSIASGNITNWEWNFSDSSSGSSDSSNTQNPCHTFLNTSSPNVSLIVTSDSGCQNQFRSMVSFNPFAVPDFSSTTTCLGSQTCFNDLSTISSGTIASHQWNFGELNSGSADTSTVQSPCHIFSTASVYNVSLSLTTDLGCESFISQAVSVSPLPVADFISEATCLTKYSSFFDRSSFQNNDTIITWEWNFGDASPNDYRQSPVHTFNSLNTFNVSLITTTIMGCKDTINKQITVHTGPVANFTSPQQDCSPVCENFIDLSQAIDGSITQWHWDFPGGNPNTSLQQNPVICYDNAGTFPVTLIVMNSYGCRDTSYVPQYLTVHPQPVADFYLIREPENLFAPELELGHLWSNDVVKWYWDFGDSSSVDSVNQDPVHTYIYSVLNNNYYNFNIMLEVKNQFGCVAKLNREINIQPLFSFFIPNTFTPNAESPNDLYFGKGRGILEYKIVIFDRWGIAIWECESKGDYREWDKDNGNGMPAACQWDGIYQGRSVQEDVYVWKVELKNIFGDRFNYIGHVNVVR